MVKKKSKSKRVTLHQKYKILRKVREHKRKLRKSDRGSSKKQKNPGIPNSWPFKHELLVQLEQARLAEEEHAKKLKETRLLEKKEAKKNNKIKSQDMTPPVVDLTCKKGLKDSVERADLVMIVLDARDPQGCRSLSLEDGLIAKGNKKVCLVMTKVDLIPPHIASKWVSYLNRFHPTIAVKGLNNKSVLHTKDRSKRKREREARYQREQSTPSLRDNGSVEPLVALVKALGRQHKAENRDQPLRIALVGYPNVGKSTLINAIKKRSIQAVDPCPYTTKAAAEIAFNDQIILIDCPPLDPSYSDPASIIMRHSIANMFTDYPVECVQKILDRVDDSVALMQSLRLPIYKDYEDLLQKLALKQNIIRKGGEPNVLAMALTFIKNLGNGVYSAVCIPPSKSKSRFEMPSWYQDLALTKMDQLHTALFGTVAEEWKRLITLRTSPTLHRAGDFTEYDLIVGTLPECDGLTTDEDSEADDEVIDIDSENSVELDDNEGQ